MRLWHWFFSGIWCMAASWGPAADDMYYLEESTGSDTAADPCIIHICPSLSRGLVLTFDDGPVMPNTAILLDNLQDLGITAVFFVVGEKALKYPELIVRMAAEGHWIGSHTMTHANLTALEEAGSWDDVEEEIIQIEDILQAILGEKPLLFRAPFGALTSSLRDYLFERGYTIVSWNAGNIDWYYNNITASGEAILMGISDAGGITTWHDTTLDTAVRIGEFVTKAMKSHKILSPSECFDKAS